MKELTIIPGDTSADDYYQDVVNVNKVLKLQTVECKVRTPQCGFYSEIFQAIKFEDPIFTLPLAEVVFLCKAGSISRIPRLERITPESLGKQFHS